MKPILFRNFFALSLLLAHCSVLSQHFMHQSGTPSGKVCLNQDHNMSVRLSVSGGTSSKARNGDGTKVELLNLYGDEETAYMFHGVDLSYLTGNLLILGQNLQVKDLTNKSATFGNVRWSGKMNMFSGKLSIQRHISDHFSMKVSAPFHHFNIKNTSAVDLTAANEIDGDVIAATANFDALLAAYNIHAGDVKDFSFGDIQMFNCLHFTREADETLGQATVSIASGITLPTARQRKLTEAFYVPMGNNGHVGFPMAVDATLSVHKNATFTVHFGSEMFLKHDGVFRMKTDINQNGFIKLATGQAREKLGYKCDVNGGIHMHDDSKEYGLGVEYRWERQGKTTLVPFDTANFDETIVNSDSMLQTWQRHNIVVKASFAPQWDEANHESACPRFSFSYTQPIKGKRIFNTNMFAGSLGLDFTWDF